jgi:hypothetical protein
MKKTLLALLVLASLVSCGKNNSVSSTSTSALGTGTSALSSSTTDAYGRIPLTTYIANINNNGFAAARADSEIFRFYTSSSSNSGCSLHTALGGFLSYYSCSGGSASTGTYTTTNVTHSTEDLTAKKNELIGLLGQTYQYSNSADKLQLYIQTTAGDVYTIDFRVPMSANPVVKYTRSSGQTVLFDYSFSGYSAY